MIKGRFIVNVQKLDSERTQRELRENSERTQRELRENSERTQRDVVAGHYNDLPIHYP